MTIAEMKDGDHKDQAQLLKDMDRYLRDNVQDEEIFERWLMCGVPDGANDDDYIEIADSSEDFHDMLRLFADILIQDDKES